MDQKGVQGPRRSEKSYTGDDIGVGLTVSGLDAAIPQRNVNICTLRLFRFSLLVFYKYFGFILEHF